MKKISHRMLLFILLPTLLFFVGNVAYVSLTLYNQAEKEAEALLKANGQTLSEQMKIQVEKPLEQAETISLTFQSIIESGGKPDREEAKAMLKRVLESNDAYISVWMFWEENAFDGKDAEHKFDPGHDETGRFIPSWSRKAEDDFVLAPVRGYDVEGEMKDNIDHVLATGEKTIFEPFQYRIDGKDFVMTSIVAPVVVDGKTVGMTGIDITLDQVDEYVSSFTFYDSGFAGLMSGEWNVLSHQTKDIIGQNYFEATGAKASKENELIQEAIKNGENYLTIGYSNALSTDVYRLFTPVQFDGVKTPWSAFVQAPVNEVLKETKTTTLMVVVVSLAVIVLLTVIIVVVTRQIVGPIQQVVEQMEHISRGDLSNEMLKVKTKDETGKLANSLNQMQASLRKLIGNVANASTTIAKNSEELTQSANEVSEGAEQMVTTMQELAAGSETQANRASDLAMTMNVFSSKIEDADNEVKQIRESSQHVLEMTQQGTHLMEKSKTQMEFIDQIVNAAVEKVEGLDSQAQEISQLVQVIHNIAEQTNLLALNATIEAARAGEYGQGFAVVANEVRKLAEESARSVENITEIVSRIQNESSSVASSLRDGYKEVEQGTVQIATTNETFNEISNSVTEMIDKIHHISELLADIVANSQEMNKAIEDIAAISEESAAGVEETTAMTEQTNAAMEDVAQSSTELAKLAEELNLLVEQFKLK